MTGSATGLIGKTASNADYHDPDLRAPHWRLSTCALAFRSQWAQDSHVISPFGLTGHNPLVPECGLLDIHNEPDYSFAAPDLRAAFAVWRPRMAIGTVKFFDANRGFGFIQPEDGAKDVFVHKSAVESAGMTTLNEGQRIRYEVTTERGKTAASNLEAA